MDDRVHIELFEVDDVLMLLAEYKRRREMSTSPLQPNLHVEELVNAIGEIYEAALVRMRRAALS
jgi:hypothetical protein